MLSKAKKVSTKSPIKAIDNIKKKVSFSLGKYAERYMIINTEKDLEAFFEKALESGIIAIDTETTGLNPILNQIVGLSMATRDHKPVYVPINHISSYTRARLPNQLSEAQIKPIFDKYINLLKNILHNAKFDIRVIKWQLDVDMKNIYWDTYVGAHLLNENESHSLKYLYNKYVLSSEQEDEVFKFNDLFEGTKFNEVPIDTAFVYAAHDAEMTLDLYDFQCQFLSLDVEEKYKGISNVFNNIEMPCIKVVAEMEDNGIAIDREYSKDLSDKYHTLLNEAKENYYACLAEYNKKIDMYKKVNKNASKLSDPISYASPSQLSVLLYDIICVKAVDKDNPRGTGEDILTKIDLPICKAILKCREYEKLLGTYIDKLPELVNPKTNKLHTFFNQCGTVTGRFSSSSPNFQNIPSHNTDIRKMFVADEGCVLVGSDYSQQEPRTLASICEDENLIQAYKDGKDIYAWIASMVYKVPYEACKEFNPDGTKNPEGKERRSRMKAIVLGIMYSKGSASIANDLGISKKEADNIFNTFFEEFPSVKRFIETSQQYAIDYGYVSTLWGRKRRLPDIQLPKYDFKLIEGVNEDPLDFSGLEDLSVDDITVDLYTKKLDKCFYYEDTLSLVNSAREDGVEIKVNTMKIEDARRQCVNSIIQGSAADMVKLALISIYNDKQLKDWGFKLIMTVHDEIIGQCPIENAKKVSERLSQVMIESALERVSVPMKCDAEITRCWTGETIEC